MVVPVKVRIVVPAVLAALGLAACDNLPQPFRHQGPPPPLTRPVEARAVVVQPVDDTPAARAMAAALVGALTAREIPALMGSPTAGARLLHGTAAVADGQVALDWVLDGPDHRPQSSTRQTLPAATWQQAAPEALDPLAGQAVAALTADTPEPVPVAPAAPHRPTVRLQPPSGAPGDGDTALALAMKNALERHGILVVGEGGDYLVEARITITSSQPGEQMLAVAWVMHGNDGKVMATINQNGAVAAGRLEQPWGGLARQIAEGGAEGVAQVLDSTGHAGAAR